MPRVFATVRELIYWEYAKLISEKAVGDRLNYKFVNFTHQKLMHGRATPSSILSENKQLLLMGDVCAYCGTTTGSLHWEHIVPRSIGGPDNIDNMVRACAACNLRKGARDPYQWCLGNKITAPISRVVLGKFLKVVFDEYAAHDLLDSAEYMRNHAVERITLSDIFLHSRGE
ncbi:HNH endonuclease [Immundisolibacter cernigliae]|uniref:HNH endonuclease n=1 Tax=Immundisolibacter cernigliae TaxID=1810504 RepID=UPI0009F568AB|nr:HNH endonuclease [Immundisolibacter cernigliae]